MARANSRENPPDRIKSRKKLKRNLTATPAMIQRCVLFYMHLRFMHVYLIHILRKKNALFICFLLFFQGTRSKGKPKRKSTKTTHQKMKKVETDSSDDAELEVLIIYECIRFMHVRLIYSLFE